MESKKYYITDGWGDSIVLPTIDEMRMFLERLDIDDEEHCEVWLSHYPSGWNLSCFPSNTVIFELITDEKISTPPRHLENVSRDRMLNLWEKLANGQIDELEKEQWLLGYTSKPVPQPPNAKDIYREYWRILINSERISNLKCKSENCNEEPISLSVFCPKHHFEMVNKIPCPFE